jgi:shikimate kinase
MVRNIVLAGMMGTGKTAVGVYLAGLLKVPFYDVDTLIEQEAGMSIPEIFEKKGEAYFRALERQVVTRVSEREGCVIATGGGTIVDPENLRLLRRSGEVICLTATPERIFERVERAEHRPLLRHQDTLHRIRELMALRASSYAQAGEAIDTTDLAIAEVAVKVLERVGLREALKG